MVERGLDVFFDVFLRRESVFFDKKVLQTSYIPESILHREEHTKQIANILAPILRGDKPSNLFVYGKTGTGKTLSIKYTTAKLMEVASRENIPLQIIYLNCKMKRSTDTEYRLIAQLARELGKAIPPTGLPTEEVYRLFFRAVSKQRKNLILILDEIDQLVNKTGDNALYNLTRMNEDTPDTQISIIGISNDVTFVDSLDPRVRSSLSEEELVFPPYNAFQIQTILAQRAEKAFNKEVIEPGVIQKCAAYAARDHGDARRAIELLRVSGEIADRKNSKTIMIEHIDDAEKKIDKDRLLDLIATQPKQYQLVLYSIISLQPTRDSRLFTGEVYELYKSLCNKTQTSILTQRRISDIISEFDMFGIVNAKVISKGRYGRTRDISLEISESMLPRVRKIIEDSIKI
jgi:archaeal cell division control protein 6